MGRVNSLSRARLEVLESRLLLSGPPEKFVIPVGGTPQIDWAIQAYTDRDPRPNLAIDYRGRGYTFDGSHSVHFGLADLAAMDRGVAVFSAASGTVLEVHDGEFDRHVVNLDPPPQDNYVLINHGDGWLIRYGRLRNGSISVSPGQVLAAGQQIGLVGASGNFATGYLESDAFLDFDVMHDGEHIETFLDPQAYWQSPPPFAGDAPAVFYMTTTNKNFTNDATDGFQGDEHLSRRRVFHRGEQVFVFTLWHGLNAGRLRQYRYFRPDGTSFTDTANDGVDRAITTRGGSITLGSGALLGTWQVAALYGGVELGRTSFLVTDPSQGLSEIKVYQNLTYIIDGRTTPLDFGHIAQDGGPEKRAFTIQNYGTQPLNISEVTVPAGFSIVGSLPNGIPGGSSAMVNLQLDDATIGAKGGTVTIFSNDTDNADFEFNLKGSVDPAPTQNTPPEKFIIPIGGMPQVDWAVTAYFDRDPSPGASIDYRGRQYSIDGNTSVHFALPDYAAMDRGVDVFAAAPGTVIAVHDGEFDRHLSFLNPPAINTPDNYILIDHGDGWLSRYGRLRNGSVSVTLGQVVVAGQIIGEVGGSGNPSPGAYSESSAFLSFDVTHNGEHIDTFRNAAGFWITPPPFAGDSPGVHYMTTTESMPPTPEAWEGFSTRHVFHPGEQVYTLAKWHGRNRDGVTQYHFYAPDDTNFLDTANTTTDDRPQGWRFHTLTLGNNPPQGTWQVAMEYNGVELGRTSFIVADPSQGLPEIKLYDNTNYVIDGRTTPIDFGSIPQSSGPITRRFTIWNYGTKTLNLSEVALPQGFTLVTTMPTFIAPATFLTMDIQLDDELAGSKGGQVIIHSDDPDNLEFNFAIKGTITPVAATVTASEFLYDGAPQRLTFAFSHNVSASLSASDLTIERLGPGGGPLAIVEPTYTISTNTATFTLAGILPDGNYRATLSAAGVLNGNTPMASDQVLNFFVLAGDLNHDRTVSIADFITLASHFGKTDATYSDGDTNYDGMVSIADFIDLASNFNKTLIEPAPFATPQPAAAIESATDTSRLDEQTLEEDQQGVLAHSRRLNSPTKNRRQPHHRRHARANFKHWRSRTEA